jgi:hypothetical protein
VTGAGLSILIVDNWEAVDNSAVSVSWLMLAVVADPDVGYFGTERTLLPGPGAMLAGTRFEDWRQTT